jgi:hypothetical protein
VVLSVCVPGAEQTAGFEAVATEEVVDLSRLAALDPRKFFRAVQRSAEGRLTLEKDRFYILATKERVSVPVLPRAKRADAALPPRVPPPTAPTSARARVHRCRQVLPVLRETDCAVAPKTSERDSFFEQIALLLRKRQKEIHSSTRAGASLGGDGAVLAPRWRAPRALRRLLRPGVRVRCRRGDQGDRGRAGGAPPPCPCFCKVAAPGGSPVQAAPFLAAAPIAERARLSS